MPNVGVSCTSGVPALLNGATYVTPTNPVDVNGTINSWCVHTQGAGNARLKIFRDDGTNYNIVGYSNLVPIVSGSNIGLPCNIAVLIGDLIGVYTDTPDVSRVDSTPISYYKTGDIITSSAKTTWITVGDGDVIPVVGAQTLPSDIYVNSSTGNDSNVGDSCVAGHPFLTFQKAYQSLATDGTIHVCNSGADFSAETVILNKSFSIDLNGSSGNFYMPKAS